MINLRSHGGLSRSFREGANEEAHRRFLNQRREQLDRERRQKQGELEQGDADFVDLATAIVTSEQADQFAAELNLYHEATYEALRDNELQLETAREQLQTMLKRAHVLEDGRRVFKTEDGLRVFDEHGIEIGTDTITPGEISNDKPRYEQLLEQQRIVEGLEMQRSELLEFQSELDEAQELLDSGKMTQGRFLELRERLASDAPETVKTRMPELGANIEEDTLSTSAIADIDLDTELAAMPTPKPFVPGGG